MNKQTKTVLIMVICIIAVVLIYLAANNLVPLIKDHVMRMHGIH